MNSDSKSNTFLPSQYNGPTEFVHLHNHTVFSAMDGVSTPEQYAQQCYDRGYPAMSATEHGHLASVPDMYLAFREYGIRYIPGAEIYYNDWEPKRQQLEDQGVKVRSNEWRAENPLLSYRVARNRHLTILCKNQTGFVNLVKLTTNAYEIGRYGMGRMQFNRVWFDELCKYREGLIVLSGCLNGPVCHELRFRELKNKDGEIVYEHDQREGNKEACRYIKKFKEAFGDDYYIELQMPGIPDDDKIFRKLITLADHYQIQTVLTNDCHYLNRSDYILQKIMMAVAQNTTIDSPDLFHVNSDEQYMKTRAELWAHFKNHEYSQGIDDRMFELMCDNTLAIAEKCEPFTVDTSPKIPEIDNADDSLRRAVAKSLKERELDKNTEKFIIDGREVTYVQQAKIELDRFITKGYSSYFLITQDLVNFGRSRGWPFSPRGSAGGSLVCYLLNIHVLDPMVWGLSFDRFLSPSRGGYRLNVQMPGPVP